MERPRPDGKRDDAIESAEIVSESVADDRVQVHLRLRRTDAELLRTIARQREQTISGAVRYLLRRHSQPS